MYCQGQILGIFSCLLVNKFVYKQINMLLHTLSWIPTMVQSFIFIPCAVFEICVLKLNNNNNNDKKKKKKKKKNFENQLFA